MHLNWKKIIYGLIHICIIVYLIMAVTSWNRPNKSELKCEKVYIKLADENYAGFLHQEEVKALLQKENLYPMHKPIEDVQLRAMETCLKSHDLIKAVNCTLSENGEVNISIEQRLPVVHIKSYWGGDYYMDEDAKVLSSNGYASNHIIASGYISSNYAKIGIVPLAKTIKKNDFWNNQIEQIHILKDKGIELVPRIGDHIIYIGSLPHYKNKQKNDKAIEDFLNKKLTRLEKFYRYGLSEAGWNKYDYINIEFNNQIICTKKGDKTIAASTVAETEKSPQEEKKQEVINESTE